MAVNILVLGFSVTADEPGFIKSARQKLGENTRFSIRKIGIGGVHPLHLKFLIEQILQDIRPDFVVLEISTSPFRILHNDPMRHQEALNWILYRCQQHRIGLAFLDLPRKDVDQEEDWVTAMHRQICAAHAIQYHLVPLRAEFLKDMVHPDPEGCAYYADHFLMLLDELDPGSQIAGEFPVATEFGVYDCVKHPDEVGMRHTRGGYTVDLAEITPDHPLTLSVQPDTSILGLLYLMGPRSGSLAIQVDHTKIHVSAYDEFCYYERVGIQVFPALKGVNVKISQLPDIPETALKKGDKDFGPRVGYVGKLLYERPLENT